MRERVPPSTSNKTTRPGLGLAFEGRKKLVFWFFAFFAKFRPASGDPSLGFGAPFWAPGGVFTARGLEKRKKPKNFESRAK